MDKPSEALGLLFPLSVTRPRRPPMGNAERRPVRRSRASTTRS
jgi:hypothetical protein